MSEKRETGKTLAILGLVAGGLYLMAHKANTAGNNPATPPPPAPPILPPPGTDPLSADPTGANAVPATIAQVNWIHNQLAQYGWSSIPTWYNATSIPTEVPQDATGAGRNMVAMNQNVTDAYQQYFWAVNTFFGWNYPAGSGNAAAVGGALTGANTQTPVGDPTYWAQMQALYTQLVGYLTPAFLSAPAN